MLTDVEIARAHERGGWRWWLLAALLQAVELWGYMPVIVTRRRLESLKNAADGYDIAVEAWDKRGREIARLREIVRVNGLRWGHTHAEIDAILDAP